jgi:hypothetical protein
MTLGYGQSDIKFQEFNSEKTCKTALELVTKADSKNIALCIAK